MRSSQWFIIGFAFILLGGFFISEDFGYRAVCGVAGFHSEDLDLGKTPEPLVEGDLWCINTEIYDPFIWLLNPLGIVFIICGWIELVAEKRRR